MRIKNGVRSFAFFVGMGALALLVHNGLYHLQTDWFGWWRGPAVAANFAAFGIFGFMVVIVNDHNHDVGFGLLGAALAMFTPAWCVWMEVSQETDGKIGTSNWKDGAMVLASVLIFLIAFYALTIATSLSTFTALLISLGVLVCQVLIARGLERVGPVYDDED